MRSTKKARRVRMLVFGGVALALAAALFGFLARDTIAFFKSPTEVLAGGISEDQLLRVGGLVVKGSVRKVGVVHHFKVTDLKSTVPVTYRDVLPDLFQEGKSIVAEGHWKGGVFVAREVLAKHDENYRPREVEEAIAKGKAAHAAAKAAREAAAKAAAKKSGGAGAAAGE